MARTPTGTTLGPESTYSTGNINSGGGAGFNLNTATATITTLGSPFSMTSVVNVSVGSGAVVNFTTDLVLSQTAVPEPSTMAIAGIGALGMIGYGLRRRKAKGARAQPVNLMARMSGPLPPPSVGGGFKTPLCAAPHPHEGEGRAS